MTKPNDRVEELNRPSSDAAESPVAELQRDVERLRAEDQKAPASKPTEGQGAAAQNDGKELEVDNPYLKFLPSGEPTQVASGEKFDPGAYAEGIFDRRPRPDRKPDKPDTKETTKTETEESTPKIEPVVEAKWPNRRNFNVAEDGTITANYPNGDTRTFTTDPSDKVLTLAYFDKAKGISHEYTRIQKDDATNSNGNDNFKYQQKDASGKVVSEGSWRGDMVFSEGRFAIRDADQAMSKMPAEFWLTRYTDGASYRERNNDDGTSQIFNDKWGLVRLDRPDGSGIQCLRTDDGNMFQFAQVKSNGERITWTQDQNRQWVANSADIAPSANPPIDQQGTLQYKNVDGTLNRVNRDGSADRTNPDGTVVHLDKDGMVATIVKPNGDYRKLMYADGAVTGFADYSRDGKEKGSSQGLTDIQVNDRGHMSYTTAEGNRIVEGPSNSRAETLPDGRLKSMTYPNGDRRSFNYANGSDQIAGLTYYSRAQNKTFDYTRNGDTNEFSYKTTDAQGRVSESGKWPGDMQFRHGMFSSTGQGDKQGFWHSRSADGKEYFERENKDGSQQVFDSNWKLASVYRPDGSELHCQRVNGQLVNVSDISETGKQTNWNFDKRVNQWYCDNPQINYTDKPPINENGELNFTDRDGTVNKQFLDGRVQRTNLDATVAHIAPDGVVERVVRPNGDYRKFLYEGGAPVGYTDFGKDGSEKQTVKDLKQFSVNDHGDVGFEDADGRKVLQRTDGTGVKYKKDDANVIEERTCPDGSSRRFYYEAGKREPVQMLDTTWDGKAWHQDLWQRRQSASKENTVPGASMTWERLDIQSGKVLERRNGVMHDQFGDYTFTGPDLSRPASRAAERFHVPTPQPAAPVETKQPEKQPEEPRRRPFHRIRPQEPDTKPVEKPVETNKPEVTETRKQNRPLTADERLEQLVADNVRMFGDGSIMARFPSGDTRKLVLKEGTEQVDSLVHFNKKENRNYEYTRAEAAEGAQPGGVSSYNIKVSDATTGKVISQAVWKGAVEWRDNTLYSKDAPVAGQPANQADFWRSISLDGTRSMERRTAGGATQVYDTSGSYNLMSLTRPDGSKVECTRENGKLTGVTDIRNDGTRTSWIYDAQAKNWVSDAPGYARLTNAPVNQQGELDYIDASGARNNVLLDGSSKRTNPDQSALSITSDGVITRVSQPGGDYREIKYGEGGQVVGFADYAKNGTPKGGMDGLADAGIDYNGHLTYTAENGARIAEGMYGARVEASAAGPHSIRYPNGDSRTFVRAEGSDQLQLISHFSKKENLTREYSRSGVDGEWNYKVVDAAGKVSQVGIWKGQMEFRDGIYAVKGQNTKAPEGFWHERDANGREYIERDNADGSKQRFDFEKKGIVDVTRTDGSTLHCERVNGELVAVNSTDRNGLQTNWAYNRSQGKWVSDAPGIPPAASAPIDENGQLIYRTSDQTLNKICLDGSEQRTVAGGARVDVNREGQAHKITQKNGDYRMIAYENGAPTGYVDYAKDDKEKQKVTGLENLQVSPLGDVEYTVNGARVVDRADLSKVEFDPKNPDLINRVTSIDGSYRQFIYNEKNEIVQIDDVTKSKSSERHATYLRRDNVRPPFGPGGLSDSFERVDAKTGRVTDTRSDVVIDNFGDYSYIDSRGRERLSKANGRFRGPDDEFSSATIDEAHSFLVDSVAVRFNDDRKTQAFEQMMKGFERRMSDTVRRRTSIGEDEEKVCEEVEKQVAMAYDNIGRMLESDDKGFDNAARRAQLAEAFMYLLWEPQTAKQGGRNSCWFMSQWNEDVAQYPGTFAKMFADVSLTGHCKDRTGKDYSFSQDDLAQTRQNHGVGWSIAKAGKDDQTSPAVDRMERVLLVIGGWGAYRWQSGGGADNARNALAKVVEKPIGFIGGQFPSTRADRLQMMQNGGAVKSGGPGHLNNMFVRAIRLDALGRVMQENRDQRKANRQGGLASVSDVNSPEGEADGSKVVFGLFRGDQYERDRLVAVIKNPKAFVETGEMASVDMHYPAPQLGKEFQIADSFQPSDFKPGRNNRFNNDNEDQPRRFFRWRR